MKKRSKQRFSIRKSNFGVVSVLLGTFALLSMNISASANEIGTSIDGGNNNSTISLGESDNSSDVFRDTSVDLTSDIRETNYVTDATITLSDDYIEALEERNTLMNALKGQNDDLTDRNLPKKSATDSDNIDNLNRLSQLGEEHLRANTYDGSADTRPVDPLNLTDEQFEELNIFSSDIANQIRQQVIDYQTKNNKQVTVELAYVSEGMQDFAKEVTERVQAKDLQVGISGVENLTYEVDIINSAAKNHYLDTTAADYETKFQGTPNQRPASLYVVSTYFPNTYETWQKTIRLTDITMGQMKEIIYQGYLTGLFTLAAENREHRKWEHALNITSLETRRQPHIQPNTMISSGLTFIQRRAMAQDAAGNWTVVAGLSGDYYPVFNFYQDSYSPVEENRIYYGETAPGYLDGFNKTILKNVEKAAPVVETVTKLIPITNGVEEYEVTKIDGVETEPKLLNTYSNSENTVIIEFVTEYKEDKQLDYDKRTVKQEGSNGYQKSGVTYTVENNQLVETPINERKEPITKITTVGTKPSVTKESIGFTTDYVEDRTADAGVQNVTTAGVAGTKEVTVTYVLDTSTGEVTAQEPIVKVIAEPKSEVVTVGTKPSVTEESLEFSKQYVEDNTLPAGVQTVTTAGVAGTKEMTVTYVLDTSTGEVTVQEPTEKVVLEPKSEIVTVGTKPSIKAIDFETIYQLDDTLKSGETKILVVGQEGSITTPYILDEKTGVVVEDKENTETVSPINQIIAISFEDALKEEIPYGIDYEDDAEFEPGYTEVIKQGVAGTKYYIIVDGKEIILSEIQAENEVVKRGTGFHQHGEGEQADPKPEAEIKVEVLPFTTREIADENLALGQRIVDQEGKDGSRTYVVTPEGEVELESILAIEKLVRVGTKLVEIPTEENITTPEETEKPSVEENTPSTETPVAEKEVGIEEEVIAIPDYAPEEDTLPEYIFDPADFQDVPVPVKETETKLTPTDKETAGEIVEKSSKPQAGGGAAAGQDIQIVSAGRPTTSPATPSYSRVARAKSEKSLPNTGDSASILGMIGLGLTSFGLVGQKRRKK